MKKPDSHDPRNTSNAGQPVRRLAQALLAVKKQPQESGLQEEGEQSFHGQRLADHAAGEAREVRPVCAELEFHGNSGHHADHKIDAKDLGPETGGPVVASSSFRSASVFRITISGASPMVSCGNR